MICDPALLRGWSGATKKAGVFVSIFNDVIGPVMRGPSSSHCAAALRIGRLARDLLGGELREVLVEFDRGGALPTTHDTQGSDMGLFGGLMGGDAADERLPGSMQTLRESGVQIRIETVDAGDPHPNTYRLTLTNGPRAAHTAGDFDRRWDDGGDGCGWICGVDGRAIISRRCCGPPGDGIALHEKVASRVEADAVLLHGRDGAGLVEVKAQEFVPDAVLTELRSAGLVSTVKRLAPVLPVRSLRTTRVPFSTCAEMLAYDAGKNTPLWKLAVAYECTRGGLREDEVVGMMIEIVRILRRPSPWHRGDGL